MLRIHNEEDLLQAVKEDRWMIDILAAARELQLPDSWVCAGFVRSKVWDVQHGFAVRTPLADVDVIYYDPEDLREEVDVIQMIVRPSPHFSANPKLHHIYESRMAKKNWQRIWNQLQVLSIQD